MAPNNVSETMENPNEGLVIPQWINEDYFQPILEKDIENYSKIINFKPIAATQPGENYCSIMVRVFLEVELKDGSTQKVSYILKTCLLGDKSAALISSMNFFPKEMHIYQHILPNLEKLYEEVGASVKLGPKCIFQEEHPERFNLVFEDLKQSHFKNVDRLQGLDMKHMTESLRKVAELHAASAVYHTINGSYGETFNESFYSQANRTMFEMVYQIREPTFLKGMQEWNLENFDHYMNKRPNSSQFFDAALKLNEIDENAFNVLNHGDCWSNNIMFQYKDSTEQEIANTIFVDFQICKWGSPAHDLWYLIVNSAAYDIRVAEFDNFIRIYHQRLVECLKMLKYTKNIPSLKQLHIMMLDYGYWAYMTSTSVLCAICMPSDKDSNMENILKPGPEADAIRYRMFSNPIYAKAMCQLLPFFDKKGILDIAFQ